MEKDKKYQVDWTLHDCEWTSSDDYVYSGKYNDWSDIKIDTLNDPYAYKQEITYNLDLFAEFDDEVLRDKYPELMAAWEQYQTLLDKYRMWDNVTNPPESD